MSALPSRSLATASRMGWLVPLPPALELTAMVRGTLLVASREQLRVAGVFDPYAARLSPESLAALQVMVPASWVPVELARAHYAAADELDLEEQVIIRCARASGEKVNHAFLSTALALAREVGVTPWTGIPIFAKVWSRLFVGGGFGVQQLGPKDARVVIAAHPLVASRYHRIALRSHLELALGMFAKHVNVRETARDPVDHRLSLLLRWV